MALQRTSPVGIRSSASLRDVRRRVCCRKNSVERCERRGSIAFARGLHLVSSRGPTQRSIVLRALSSDGEEGDADSGEESKTFEEGEQAGKVDEDDYRAFRARLVAMQRAEEAGMSTDDQAAPSTSSIPGSGSGWVYETPLLEQGAIILGGTQQKISFGLRQQYFHKCVLLIIQHDDNFTKGVILNRPSSLHLEGMEQFGQIWCGGDVEEGGMFKSKVAGKKGFQKWPAEEKDETSGEEEEKEDEGAERVADDSPADDAGTAAPKITTVKRAKRAEIICLHQSSVEAVREASEPIIKNKIYQVALEDASYLVSKGLAEASEFLVFVGYAGWAPGQLEGELERKSWYLASADGSLVMEDMIKYHKAPEVEMGTGRLLEGGDGIQMWDELLQSIGRGDERDEVSTFDDKMLREWVRTRLTGWNAPNPLVVDRNVVDTEDIVEISAGTLLATTPTADFVLEKQYLHRSILLIVESTPQYTITCVLNRPTDNTASFVLPGTDSSAGTEKERRVTFGGDMFNKQAVFLLHSNAELGGREIGDSGVFQLKEDYSGTINDLIVTRGFTVWEGLQLQKQILNGSFVVITADDVPWEELLQLSGPAGVNAESLEERIADMEALEKSKKGKEAEDSVLQERKTRRLVQRSNAVWRTTMESGAPEVLSESTYSPCVSDTLSLGDEALLAWVRFFS